MTTLPQTTPIRLPRPTGGSQLAVPSAASSIPSSNASGFQMNGADIWRVIRSNLWLIILLVAGAGTGGYFLNGYLERHAPKYTSKGMIQMLPSQPADPLRGILKASMDNSTLPIELRTQAQLLTSDALINDVLNDQDSDVRKTVWWTVTCKGDPQIARRMLSEELVVVPVPDSKLIQLTMTYSLPKDCETILLAIGDQHIKNQKQLSLDQNADERHMLQDSHTKYQAELRMASEDVKQMASELNISGIGTSGFISTKEIELSDKVRAQLQLQSEKNAAQASLDSFNAELRAGQDPLKVTEAVENDPTVNQYKADLDQAQIALSDLTNGKYGSSNPNVQSLQKRTEMFQRKLDDARAERAGQVRDGMRAELNSMLDSATKSLASMDTQVASVKSDMAELSNKMASYVSRKNEEDTARGELQNVDRQLEDIKQVALSSDFGTIEWAIHPNAPDSPSFPNMKATMGVAIGLGLALSLGIAFLREITDTTVRSPRDIHRVGQMNLLGMVPHESDDPQSAGARLPLVIFEAPQSIMAEHLRQVRTRLQHAASLDTTRSILVTSPSPNDGKSVIACNLAAGLALNGRRILLVDANFRRPELHRIFAVANEVGFADVLNDVNTFDSAVRETSVPNLSVLTSGPKPTNPTELLESQLLLDFIERALEEYDHVIFDSGPMLFVSDSVALAPRVDGVVTVVKARTNSRGMLTRMRDGLRSVKAEHLGVVLNGVRNQAGGYYASGIKTYYEYQNG